MKTLQARKNELRKDLAEMGILARKGENKYDKYKYFSEAQYKELITKLFAKHGIELTMTTLNVENIDGTAKMPFGRRVTVEYVIKNTDSEKNEKGEMVYESEHCVMVGEGLDNLDKALYKAYTGATKYFLASVFLIASGVEPENSQDEGEHSQFADEYQKTIIRKAYGDNLPKLLIVHGIESLDELPFEKAVSIIDQLRKLSNAKVASNNEPA